MDHNTRPSLVAGRAEQAGGLPTLFGGPQRPSPAPRQNEPAGPDFERIQSSPEFTVLRGRHRRFVFPMTLLFLAWYFFFVLLAAYAHDFMSTKVLGEINAGIVLGVLQFLTTIAITAGYVRFARKRLDPQVAQIRRNAGVNEPS